MSWLLADVKKRALEAKSTIQQSFIDAGKNGTEEEKEKAADENETKVEKGQEEKAATTAESSMTAENAKKSMAALFGGLKIGSGVASTKLFEYAKDASKKLEEVTNSVIENTMLGDLNKEQGDFEKQLEEENAKLKNVDMPWIGLPDEELAKKQILTLSTDTRNFLRDSPANSEYTYDQQQAMAAELLKEDPNLANVRFQLVPKQVKENKFWQNYFYRVGLIRQSVMGHSSDRVPPVVVEETKPETSNENREVEEHVEEKKESSTDGDKEEEENETTTEQPAAGEQTLTSVDDEWEREILADLNDYDDVVAKTGGKDDEAWEAEINELLNAE